MSKIVRVNNGDYKISVTNSTHQSYSNIVLDVGTGDGLEGAGTVTITGNLTVLGATTTITSNTINLSDRILYLNQGETGNGISFNTSGLSVDRGTLPNINILVDDSVYHYDPVTATSVKGTVVFNNDAGALVGIRTNSINTNGGNLALINSGTGKVTVTGTNAYEQQVWDYANWNQALTPPAPTGVLLLTSDPDVLTTAKSVKEYVDSRLYYFQARTIGEGGATPTSITAFDSELSGHGVSRLEFKIDNTLNAQIDANGVTVNNVNIINDTVSNTTNNLKLSAFTSNIQVQGYLNIDDQSTTAPASVSGLTKIYSTGSVGPGKSGVYISNVNTQDELVSRKRAVLLSILL
jgi:hypothetical protein